ncbi:MAG: DUF6680 family protein, partial [Phycisphaerae bacterium]
MTTSVWMMILAVLLAPVVAIQVQKMLEHLRERRWRKMNVFQALMATRSARVSPEHVRALNMIDLEFSGIRFYRKPKPSAKDKRVLSAWKAYRAHLNEQYDRTSQDAFRAWVRRGDDQFLALLDAIGEGLGYNFDTVDLKHGAYTPLAFGEIELAQQSLRTFVADVTTGRRAIPVEVRPPAENLPVPAEVQRPE